MTWIPFLASDIKELEGALCYRLSPPDADDIGPDYWFPDGKADWRTGGNAREAVAACRRCDLRAECLAQAIRNDEQHGIWGGFNFGDPEEKRRAKSARLKRKAS